ncbi:hypothetical protein L249_4359 [Ophiocordyceps polyrhachis-furcata BCC 54312]|uniref:GIY-YIG domain-containing protein n=1 Tax=Ophiocordyceps polyrhachis-furcata BCC 54312 TaxID=1330021 RepID=A0A367L7L4_9HYPO|nr:hypothetical protein L249_4359 [Ophiocordyceps polyrhachis-furcata BCC 54312]
MAWLRPRLLPLLLPSSEVAFATRRPFSSAKDGGGDGEGGDGKTVEQLPPNLTTTNETQWPLLKRKNESRTKSNGKPLNPLISPDLFSPPNKPATAENSMLIIHGLSPYLYPPDFHRLGSAGWQSVIKRVQPLRDPSTLEPDVLGRYYVTFTTKTAASSYRDHLDRLHRLSRHRMYSPTSVWQSNPPPDIAVSTNPDHIESLTILPASQPLHISRNFVKKRKAWIESIVRIITALGYSYPSDDKPRIILLRAYPPNLETAALERLIQRDCTARKCSWRVSKPFPLDKDFGSDLDAEEAVHTSVAPGRAEPLEAQRCRFAFACDSDNEAHRFQRHWNQRTLFSDVEMKERHVLHATVIHW